MNRIHATQRINDAPCTRGNAFRRTLQDYETHQKVLEQNHAPCGLTGDFWMVRKMESRIGFIKDVGGVTPHIRTSNLEARVASSSLSLTKREKKFSENSY